MPVYLVVPQRGIERLHLPIKTNPFVVAVQGDYSDAIVFADAFANATNLTRDGGARNVASRGGLGTVMLNAVVHPEQGAKRLFDHYFQAVSSGSGAIAAWEAVQLLLKDGRFGDTATKIHVAQNAPFTPIVDAWENGERDLAKLSARSTKENIDSITADVLTNRHPAYGIAGGVFDVLKASNGMAWKISNDQLLHATLTVKEAEGIDIDPAAAVAVGALRQGVDLHEVKQEERILLNITGGGKDIRYSGEPVYRAKPNVTVKQGELDVVLEKVGSPEKLANHKTLLKRIDD
jgi:cysteate synthase